MITKAQAVAIGRHVVTYAAGAATAAAALNIISAGDAATIQSSIQHIVNGVSEIGAGLAPLIGLASALYASWSASHKQQVKAVAALPNTTVVTTPELAHSTPEANVVSSTEVKVVPK